MTWNPRLHLTLYLVLEFYMECVTLYRSSSIVQLHCKSIFDPIWIMCHIKLNINRLNLITALFAFFPIRSLFHFYHRNLFPYHFLRVSKERRSSHLTASNYKLEKSNIFSWLIGNCVSVKANYCRMHWWRKRATFRLFSSSFFSLIRYFSSIGIEFGIYNSSWFDAQNVLNNTDLLIACTPIENDQGDLRDMLQFSQLLKCIFNIERPKSNTST